MKVTLLGGAGTVTGSKYLVSDGQTRLLVDCGLFQGLKALRLRNWSPLPVRPEQIDAVALTHAHIDHSGYLPVLVRDGFAGPIYASPPTRDLCNILLPDSGYLQEEAAQYANKKQFSKHHPALPLYTEKDARRVARRFHIAHYRDPVEIGGLTVRFREAGHILGAASVEVSDGKRTALFSGDLGRPDDLLMRPPAPAGSPDYVFIESTYGNRLHSDVDVIAEIGGILSKTFERRGVVLIPAFAVGRAQAVLYCIHELLDRGAIESVPVYLNSPMAIDVTELYEEHAAYHRLGDADCSAVCRTATLVGSVQESIELNQKSGPMVIISASGMLTGGRILHHLRQFGPDERNTILLPGFQAPGTRGAALAAGAESVKLHGRYVPVRAEVIQIDALSAHADQADLLAWLASCDKRPREVYLVHGEPVASDALRVRIAEELGLSVHIPEHGDTIDLA